MILISQKTVTASISLLEGQCNSLYVQKGREKYGEPIHLSLYISLPLYFTHLLSAIVARLLSSILIQETLQVSF